MDDESQDHQVVETPPTLWQTFLAGNAAAALASGGAVVGFLLAVAYFDHWHRKIIVDKLPPGPQHVFWLALGAFAGFFLLAPKEFAAFRVEVYVFDPRDWRDWCVLAAGVGGAFVGGVAIGRWT